MNTKYIYIIGVIFCMVVQGLFISCSDDQADVVEQTRSHELHLTLGTQQYKMTRASGNLPADFELYSHASSLQPFSQVQGYFAYEKEKYGYTFAILRAPAEPTPAPTPAYSPTPTPDADKTSYALDLSGVTKTNNTSGTGMVTVSGGEPTAALYARVTWVYTLSNEDSFAYCAMKAVKRQDEALLFNMVSPKAPYGATLDSVQVALVTDPDADAKGSYDALATARK